MVKMVQEVQVPRSLDELTYFYMHTLDLQQQLYLLGEGLEETQVPSRQQELFTTFLEDIGGGIEIEVSVMNILSATVPADKSSFKRCPLVWKAFAEHFIHLTCCFMITSNYTLLPPPRMSL